MIDITNYNSKGQLHGYQELYNVYGLFYRGNWKNKNQIGYHEWHNSKIIRYFIT